MNDEYYRRILTGGIIIMVICLGLFCFKHFKTADYYIRNGYVTDKKRKEVSCRHSYKCNCVEHCNDICTNDSNGKESCSKSCYEVCDTCYEHFYDVDWVVESTAGYFYIHTVDRQGLIEPKRWTIVNKGDPTATTAYFKNPIKGNKLSLFNNQKKTDIKYPNNIYDYYKIDRFINLTTFYRHDLNKDITALNTVLSDKHNVNVVLILSSDKDHDFYQTLEANWLNGKLNDVIVGINIDKKNTINLVHIISFADELFKHTLQSDIASLKTFNYNKVEQVLLGVIEAQYKLPDLKEFAYLLQ